MSQENGVKFEAIADLEKEGYEVKTGRQSLRLPDLSSLTEEQKSILKQGFFLREDSNIDLVVYPGGECLLLRDVKAGETIVYNNTPDATYISKNDEPLKCEVYEDLKAGTKLKAGAYVKGKVVIEADAGTGDWLAVHIQE